MIMSLKYVCLVFFNAFHSSFFPFLHPTQSVHFLVDILVLHCYQLFPLSPIFLFLVAGQGRSADHLVFFLLSAASAEPWQRVVPPYTTTREHMFVFPPKAAFPQDQPVKGLVRRLHRVVKRLFADNLRRARPLKAEKRGCEVDLGGVVIGSWLNSVGGTPGSESQQASPLTIRPRQPGGLNFPAIQSGTIKHCDVTKRKSPSFVNNVGHNLHTKFEILNHFLFLKPAVALPE